MGCAVKDALMKDYRDFTAGYVRAVKRMKKDGPAMAQSVFSALRELAKDCEKKAKLPDAAFSGMSASITADSLRRQSHYPCAS